MSGRLGRAEADESNRRSFIGGSDARIIMGNDEAALLRLWREKRAEVEPEDLSGNLIVQLGVVTEPLNRHWYERNSRQTVKGPALGQPPPEPVDRGRAHQFGKAAGCHGGRRQRSAPPVDEENAARLFSPCMPRLSKPKAFPTPVFTDEF